MVDIGSIVGQIFYSSPNLLLGSLLFRGSCLSLEFFLSSTVIIETLRSSVDIVNYTSPILSIVFLPLLVQYFPLFSGGGAGGGYNKVINSKNTKGFITCVN